ncbi:TPA: TIGR01741 family protein [Staphylococcus aureus]|nr:TIGR01741 family protein [Staphylococcus aureus]HDJ4242763.1 TIGR01741 family protein [Staphylococcus aureus]
MNFEEKLSEMYNKIANEINEMIPVEWEKVYVIAYVDDGGGQVIFYYTKPRNDELYYYSSIVEDYNVLEEIFDDLWMELYRSFKKLRNIFKEDKLKVSFDYIDWKNTEFDQLGQENYYNYRKFGIIPEMEYEMEEVKQIEQYIKEQEEAEQ